MYLIMKLPWYTPRRLKEVLIIMAHTSCFMLNIISSFLILNCIHLPLNSRLWDALAQTKACIMQVINSKDRKFWGKVTNAWGEELPSMVVKLTL